MEKYFNTLSATDIYSWFKEYRYLSKNPEKLEVMSKFCDNFILKFEYKTDPKSLLTLKILNELKDIITIVKNSDIEYNVLTNLAKKYMNNMDNLRMILFYEIDIQKALSERVFVCTQDENGKCIFNAQTLVDFGIFISEMNTKTDQVQKQLILNKK